MTAPTATTKATVIISLNLKLREVVTGVWHTLLFATNFKKMGVSINRVRIQYEITAMTMLSKNGMRQAQANTWLGLKTLAIMAGIRAPKNTPTIAAAMVKQAKKLLLLGLFGLFLQTIFLFQTTKIFISTYLFHQKKHSRIS